LGESASFCAGPARDSSNAAAADPPASASIAVGAAVQCRFEGGEELFAGAVAAARSDGTYDIQYDDGDFESAVPAAWVVVGSASSRSAAVALPSSSAGDEHAEDGQDDTYGDASFDDAFESEGEHSPSPVAVVVKNKVLLASAGRYCSCASHSSSTLIARPDRYRAAADHGEGSYRAPGRYHEAEPSSTDNARRQMFAVATSACSKATPRARSVAAADICLDAGPASQVMESRPWQTQCLDLEGNSKPSAGADRCAFATYELQVSG